MALRKIFSHYVGCCSVLLLVFFAFQNLLIFMRSQKLITYHTACVVLFRKLSHAFKANFSSIRFTVSQFVLKSLVLLYLSYVEDDRYRSICSLLYADNQFYKHHLLKILYLFHLIFLSSLSKTRCPEVCGFISRWSLIWFY